MGVSSIGNFVALENVAKRSVATCGATCRQGKRAGAARKLLYAVQELRLSKWAPASALAQLAAERLLLPS